MQGSCWLWVTCVNRCKKLEQKQKTKTGIFSAAQKICSAEPTLEVAVAACTHDVKMSSEKVQLWTKNWALLITRHSNLDQKSYKKKNPHTKRSRIKAQHWQCPSGQQNLMDTCQTNELAIIYKSGNVQWIFHSQKVWINQNIACGIIFQRWTA